MYFKKFVQKDNNEHMHGWSETDLTIFSHKSTFKIVTIH